MKDNIDALLEDVLKNNLDRQPPETDMLKITSVKRRGSPVRKAPRRIAAAAASIAAAALCATVGVGAAYSWDFKSIAESLFGAGINNVQSSLTEVNKQMTCNHEDSPVDITVKGYAGDSENLLVMLEITRNDGKIFEQDPNMLDNRNYWFAYHEVALDGVPLVDETSCGWHLKTKINTVNIKDENPSDNVLTLGLFLSYEDQDFNGKTLSLTLSNLLVKKAVLLSDPSEEVSSYEIVNAERFSDLWKVDFDIDYTPQETKFMEVNKSSLISCYPLIGSSGISLDSTMCDKVFTVKNISFSGLSVSAEVEQFNYDSSEDWFLDIGELVKVTLKDGTVIDRLYTVTWNTGDYTKNSVTKFRVFFNQPLNVDDIASVKIGSLEIPTV